MDKYKIIFNEGFGFTEYQKECDTIQEAAALAIECDTARIYKNNKRIF